MFTDIAIFNCCNYCNRLEPQSGIDIAFRMIDTDCSGKIDFKEFLAVSIALNL